MRKALAFGGISVLLVAILAYAGDRADQNRAGPERPVKRALQERQRRPGIHTLSYEGAGRVVEDEDGIFFNPGEERLGIIMGFNLDWNKHTMLVPPDPMAREGKVLADVTGWLEISYDAQARLLEVTLTDGSGQAFRAAYEPQARDDAGAVEFAEFLDEFFQFMNTRTDVIGTVAAGTGGCVCSCNFGSGCTANLKDCGKPCTSCTCSCTLPRTCSCECKVAETM